MVCYYRSSCLNLPVTFVDCQLEGCTLCLHHVCQGGYLDMHDIDIDGAYQKICRDCVDELWIVGKPDKLKKMGKITVYRTDE